jgi:hypothetical protein
MIAVPADATAELPPQRAGAAAMSGTLSAVDAEPGSGFRTAHRGPLRHPLETCRAERVERSAYESARSTTALRIIDAANKRGFDVNVLAYEGAVALASDALRMARMAKRILQILTTGYRATLEEQDDPILWLTHSLRNNGAEMDVLLSGSAANYAVRDQDAGGLSFGERPQTQPPDIAFEVRALLNKGARVFVLSDDLIARGIRRNETIEGLGFIAKAELPALLRAYDQVWRW